MSTIKKKYFLAITIASLILLSGLASAGLFDWLTGDAVLQPAARTNILSRLFRSSQPISLTENAAPYYLTVGDSVNFGGKKIVKLISVSTTKVVVDVSGVVESISQGSKQTVNGVGVRPDGIYSRAKLEESSALLQMFYSNPFGIYLTVGDSVNLEGRKTVKLTSVSTTKVVVDVSGVVESISQGSEQTVNGVKVRVDALYSRAKLEESSALLNLVLLPTKQPGVIAAVESVTTECIAKRTILVGETIALGEKGVKLVSVSTTKVVVDVDGVTQSISAGSSMTVNGIKVTVDSVTSKDRLEDSYATLTVCPTASLGTPTEEAITEEEMPKLPIANEYCKIISPVSTNYQWVWGSNRNGKYSGSALCANEGLACTGVAHFNMEEYLDSKGKVQAVDNQRYWLSSHYCGEIIARVSNSQRTNEPEFYSEPYAGAVNIQQSYDAVLCCKKIKTLSTS